MKERAASQDNAELAMEDVQKWIDENGPIPDKAIIFVNTGWGVRYHNRTAYFGTDTNEISKLRFPGLSIEVAKFFANHYNETGRRIVGVGIDTPSLDPGNSTTYPAHVILQAEDIFLLEHVANIEELPAIGAEVTVLPIKFTKGTGGPTRILARIPDSVPRNTPSSSSTSSSTPSTSSSSPFISSSTPSVTSSTPSTSLSTPSVSSSTPSISSSTPSISSNTPSVSSSTPSVSSNTSISA
ncbi:Kynurenine formamidase [Trinorchestia longiramus]|nr:Kynurenine formamidase [Trinorchestia longiramus]